METPHLKPHQYYIDLYDRFTVERCRRAERTFDELGSEEIKEKDLDPEETKRVKVAAKELGMHFEVGERYANKAKTIQEWMDRDRKRDELFENAQAPEGIRCLTCRNLVKPTFKDLWFTAEGPERVLFMYDCPNKCMPRRAFFSDGEEYRIKTPTCLHCNTPLDSREEDDGKKVVTTRTCSKCGYTEKDEFEWSTKKEEEYDPDFAKDRDRFCLTDEEGQKYMSEKSNLEQLGKLMEGYKKQEEERAERLKTNPKGFHLEGAGYTCFICHRSTPEGDNWYDEYGIKCLVCQMAIDKGEIPASLAKEKDSWYDAHDLERNFNVDRHALKRWLKEGVIKSRTVSNYGKGIHYELFLIEDNKDFLPPKKLIEWQSVKERKDGKDWYSVRPWYQFVDPFEHLKGYKIMNYLRVVPPEEMKAREEEKKKKWEEKRARREMVKSRHGGSKSKRKGNSVHPRK